jgi:hypothetical protein
LLLFRNQPTLAAELIRGALKMDVPRYTEARVVSADLTDIQPAEYRADMVIQLFDDAAVFGIVVEVQLSVDERKRFVWPAYVANLRARVECPVHERREVCANRDRGSDGQRRTRRGSIEIVL